MGDNELNKAKKDIEEIVENFYDVKKLRDLFESKNKGNLQLNSFKGDEIPLKDYSLDTFLLSNIFKDENISLVLQNNKNELPLYK